MTEEDKKRLEEIENRQRRRHNLIQENGEGAHWLRTYAVVEDIDSLLSTIKALGEENEWLQHFAREVMEGWPEGSILDESGLQELAIECGLLEPVRMAKPCAEDCWCAEYYSGDEWPVTCYRRRGALAVKKGE